MTEIGFFEILIGEEILKNIGENIKSITVIYLTCSSSEIIKMILQMCWVYFSFIFHLKWYVYNDENKLEGRSHWKHETLKRCYSTIQRGSSEQSCNTRCTTARNIPQVVEIILFHRTHFLCFPSFIFSYILFLSSALESFFLDISSFLTICRKL